MSDSIKMKIAALMRMTSASGRTEAEALAAAEKAATLMREHGLSEADVTVGDLRVAEVPNPRPGDRIEIGGDAFIMQGEPVRDRERLVWTVDIRPA